MHHCSIQWDEMTSRSDAEHEFEIIADFISLFFPCGGCADHFQQMYHQNQKIDSFIILIWRFHNEVTYDISQERVNFYPRSVKREGLPRLTTSDLRPDSIECELWPSGTDNSVRPLHATYATEQLQTAEKEIRRLYSNFC